MSKTKRRKTPWDHNPRELPLRSDRETPVEKSAGGAIRLHGVWVLDPTACTSQDARHFFWAGLQLLDSKAKSLGLSDEEVRQLMLASFHAFHDAANGLWGVLQEMTTKGGTLPFAAVEAHCQIGTDNGSGRTSVLGPRGLLALPPVSPITPATPVRTEPVPPAEPAVPLLESEDGGKKPETVDYPVADFYRPAGFDWTPEGYEVRAALKRYSESTHADR